MRLQGGGNTLVFITLRARARNKAKWACRHAVNEYERTIAQEAKINPKDFYNHGNHNLKTKSSIPNLVKPAGWGNIR